MNKIVPTCACGCGRPVNIYMGKPRNFIWGHNKSREFIPNKLIYQDDEITKFLIESPKHGNFEVLIDTEDWNRIKDFRWYVRYHKQWPYVAAYEKHNKKIRLHRFLMNITEENIIVDHINHNTLDNRKQNLRSCTSSENIMNQKPTRGGTSKYKGVFFSKKDKSFISSLTLNGNLIKLGYFKHEVNAALAYNEAAKKYYGEFAYLNDLSDIKEFPKEREYTSKYRGVYFSKREKRYVVEIQINKKGHYIGLFENEIEAAKAYNEAAKKYHGEKAILNDIPEN